MAQLATRNVLIYLWFSVYPIILYYAVATQQSTHNYEHNETKKKMPNDGICCAIPHHCLKNYEEKASEAAQLFRFRFYCYN